MQSSESFSIPGETWVVFFILTLRARETLKPREPKNSPADPLQLFPGEHSQGFLTSHMPGKPWAGLGSAQVSCCSSAHQLFHRVTQIPCVASARPLRPCAARRQTLPGACEFEYSWLAGSQGLSCSALRSVRGALKGRIVTCAERSRHGVSNYSSFQTTASCFGLLEQ